MNTNLIKLLLQLKNASLVKKEHINIKCNLSGLNLIKLLYKQGFIQSFSVDFNVESNQKKEFDTKVFLRYFYNKSIFKKLKIVSTPSYIKYLTYKDISKIKDKKDVLFLSTNKGFLTGLDCKKNKTGGVLLFVL
jgi:small subunit ribosomal protein S8